jgi:hypothetical protein
MAEAVSRRPGFDPGSIHVGFVVYIEALGQVFPRYFGFPLSISFHRWSITRKNEKNSIFITGLHISLKAAVRPLYLLRGPSPPPQKREGLPGSIPTSPNIDKKRFI